MSYSRLDRVGLGGSFFVGGVTAVRYGYRNVDLADGERVAVEYPASTGQVSGLLVVTNMRLLFAPIDYGPVSRIMDLGVRMIGGHAAIIGHLVHAYIIYNNHQARDYAGEKVVSVSGGGRHGDMLYVSTADGREFDFRIAASLYTVKWDSANERARDEIIYAIESFWVG